MVYLYDRQLPSQNICLPWYTQLREGFILLYIILAFLNFAFLKWENRLKNIVVLGLFQLTEFLPNFSSEFYIKLSQSCHHHPISELLSMSDLRKTISSACSNCQQVSFYQFCIVLFILRSLPAVFGYYLVQIFNLKSCLRQSPPQALEDGFCSRPQLQILFIAGKHMGHIKIPLCFLTVIFSWRALHKM